MKIGIDARLYGTGHRGIGRYIQELVSNLEKIDQNNEYFIFLAADNFDEYRPQNGKFHKVRADFRIYGIFEQLLYPVFLRKYKLDLMHFPHFNVPVLYRGRYIVTIHDLIISHYPDSRATTLSPLIYRLKLLAYDYLIKAAAARAEKIIAVSEYTKQDIIKLLKISKEKITVIYEGIDLPAADKIDCSEVLSGLGLGGEYLLYVGAAYPHKNLEKLAEAFSLIAARHPNLSLLLVGRDNFFYGRLKQSIEDSYSDIKDRVVFAGYQSDENLACLYSRAKLYVFPSLIEGFGLPPLEAQSFGLPVISSSNSCLPEIMGDSALYFDPTKAEDMAGKIETALADDKLRQDLAAKGRENIKRYSWKNMAKEILALYGA